MSDHPHDQITTEQVAHLASLARIALTDDEISTLSGELSVIAHSVARMNALDLDTVPATSHPVPLSNVFRPDVVGETLTTEQALAGAPDHDGSRFRVSAILGEEQ